MTYKLGEYLRTLRGTESLRNVSDRINNALSHSYISDIENGVSRRGNRIKPSPYALKILAKAYKADFNQLMKMAGYIESDEVTNLHFGQRLKELRKAKKITQQELGELIHVSNVSVSGYEIGKTFPDPTTLNNIADYFEVSLDYLHGRQNVPTGLSAKDAIDLEGLLNSNVNTAYGGEILTDKEKQRVKDLLTGFFWEKLEKSKNKSY